MRIEQTFTVARPPEEVFAYMIDPANLAAWQPSKVSVQPLSDGPPRVGFRVKERTRIGPRQWDQVVEFTEFEPGRVLATHIVEGPTPVDGRWTLEPDGAGGTRVTFFAEGPAPGPLRFAEALAAPVARRVFRRYHALLARNVEARASGREGA